MRLGNAGDDWKQHIITELDSALNKWVDAVPDHCEPVHDFKIIRLTTFRASALGSESKEPTAL